MQYGRPRFRLTFASVLLFHIFLIWAEASAQVPVRINSGGNAYTDSSGRVWSADKNFSGGVKYSSGVPLTGTADSLLYESERHGINFSYTIPVPNGSYLVNIHFAEIFVNAAGERIFDVVVQGRPVINNLDVFALVGKNVPLVKTVAATVSNGKVLVQFARDVDNAQVSAIEVLPLSSPASNQIPVVYAGRDQSISLPASANLNASSSDDGLPNTPGTMSYTWSKESGPGTVTFGSPAALNTTASFSQEGTYVLKLQASDGELQASDSLTVTVGAAPQPNSAPTVNAGPDQAITLPASANLLATASDDNLPAPPASLSFQWTKISGPGTVVFGAPSNLGTTASFSVAGTYVLQFTASDSTLAASDTLSIIANPAPPAPPSVRINCGGSAYTDPVGRVWGADTNFSGGSKRTNAIALPGTADSLLYQSERFGTSVSYAIPLQNGSYNVRLYFAEMQWDAAGKRVFDVSVQGQVLASNLDIFALVGKNVPLVRSVIATVSNGKLSIQLTRDVDNAEIAAIEVIPFSPSAINQAPLVHAGADQAISLPASASVAGYAADDGLPASPGALMYQWSKLSGPGTVVFAPATSLSTNLTFSAPGNYLLQLSANDGAISTSDTVAISVSPSTGGLSTVRINAGGPAYTDPAGNLWSADKLFSGGSTFGRNSGISGTQSPTLYQTERSGTSFSYAVPVQNGSYDIRLHFAEIYFTAAGKRVFDVNLEGRRVLSSYDIFAQAGENAAVIESIQADVSDGVLDMSFTAQVDNAKISAIEVLPSVHEGDPFLHVVMQFPSAVVDYENLGSVPVVLDGSRSHTHELGRHLASWIWTEEGSILGSGEEISAGFAIGTHQITLEIGDDNSPARHLSKTLPLIVSSKNAVAGPLVRYYSGSPVSSLIDALPTSADYSEMRPDLRIERTGNKINGSPFVSNVVAVYRFRLQLAAGSYELVLSPQTLSRVIIDGVARSGPASLAAGAHEIEVRVGVEDSTFLPLEILLKQNGGSPLSLDISQMSHDQTSLLPFINSLLPASGASFGGEQISIDGLGFFPQASVTVRWGETVIPASLLSVQPGTVSFTAPPGSGSVNVQVETPNGTSNPKTYSYTEGAAVAFQTTTLAEQPAPTRVAWGPDGRLYAASLNGHIRIYSFADDYTVTNVQEVLTIASLENPQILGLAFNPADPPNPVKLYVAHNLLFQNGGSCFSGTSDYLGAVSVLTGPNFDAALPLIRGLPVSNHDHGVNGLAFDDHGDLLIAMGGNTNAGIKICSTGNLPESPLSGAILKAEISKLGFNGQAGYVLANGSSEDDQVKGAVVDLAPGVDISVYSPGTRNPFDIIWLLGGRLFGTDNGANFGDGDASISATAQKSIVSQPDELLSLLQGAYYGHPNRNRGRTDSRQNVYYEPTAAPIVGQYSGVLATLEPSSNGIEEYPATTFSEKLRGHLLIQHWNGSLYDAKLSPDQRAVESLTTIPGGPSGLDVVAAPGGVLFGSDYQENTITISRPLNGANAAVHAFDFFPSRARADQAASFIIGGSGFGPTASVKIGGVEAAVSSVSSSRIRGSLPVSLDPTPHPLDVSVETNGVTSIIPRAFRYLLPPGSGHGDWEAQLPLATPLAEVASAVVNGVIYILGNGSSATYAFDLATAAWKAPLASRPFVGDHHAAETYGGKLYLFGGLGAGGNRVQIYNPLTNSWAAGANIPFSSGSASSALINGKVYYAGGISGSSTVATAAVYNLANNSWSTIAPMPAGRNHAAGGTDGRYFYVFGGRGNGSGGSHTVAEGFDDVQIYDPQTNSWRTSSDLSSGIPPLPQKRGGMGKAVYYEGELYIIGGETTPAGSGQEPGNVYNRVDVFNPFTKTWRLESPLPTARHGIFPVVHGSRIYVIAGGTQAGSSSSGVMEVFRR